MRCYGRLVGRQPADPRGAGADAAALVATGCGWSRGARSASRRRWSRGWSTTSWREDDEMRRLVPRQRSGPRGGDPRGDRRGPRSTRSSRAGSRARSPAATSAPSTRSTPSAPARRPAGAVDAERVFATVCRIGGEDGWFFAELAVEDPPRDRLAGRRAELPAHAAPSDRTARRRRHRFVARDRARAGPAAHAADGNEGAGRGRAGVRRDSRDADGNGLERHGHGLLAPGRRVGTALLVRAGPRARCSSSGG